MFVQLGDHIFVFIYCTSLLAGNLLLFTNIIFTPHVSDMLDVIVLTSSVCVCVFVWVYSGHIIHHYNGIWGTCAPGRRNMHHSGAICTMVHKGDYVF